MGAKSFISAGASEGDSELAARLALSYTKALKGRKYRVFVGAREFYVEPVDKAAAQEFFVK